MLSNAKARRHKTRQTLRLRVKKNKMHLFVYGTLKLGFDNYFARYLRQHSKFIEAGQLPGRLYDLGEYPGFVYQAEAKTFVRGEIFRLDRNVPQVLAALDEYEGVNMPNPEYRKQTLKVQSASGSIDCLVYVYCGDLSQARCLESGRYDSV